MNTETIETTDVNLPTLAILCGGGPAPGLNGVISAATIEAVNRGFRVLGFKEGFKYLMLHNGVELIEQHNMVQELTIPLVSNIFSDGGSILRMSRANPTKNPQHLENCVKNLKHYNVRYLIAIGGDGSAFSSMSVCKASGGQIQVAHVPKTIDNDLPLPNGIATFGFHTAREIGSDIVRNLISEARSESRFFIVVAMGRSAGHLALGIGKAAGAHLTLIPEEFAHKNRPITFSTICDIIETTILKRRASGKDNGVIILAEGLFDSMTVPELENTFGVLARDMHGHVNLAELDIIHRLSDEIKKRVARHEFPVKIKSKYIGYELRCAPPNAHDREYTRDLGYGAVEFLLQENKPTDLQHGGMITIQGNDMIPMSFAELEDANNKRSRVRLVDINSQGYRVALRYMIRLNAHDWKDEQLISKMAKLSNWSVEEFRNRFEHFLQ